MTINVLLAIFTYFALMIQVMMNHRMEILSFEPDFLLALLLVISLNSGGRRALIWTAVIGFLTDCISRGELGVHMFCYLLCLGILPANWFGFGKLTVKRFLIRSILLCSLMTFSGAFLSQILSGSVEWSSVMTMNLLGKILYTVLLACLFQIPVALFKQFFSSQTRPTENRDSVYI